MAISSLRQSGGRYRTAALALTLAIAAAVFGLSGASAQTEADLARATPPSNAVWLDTLDLGNMTAGWGEPHAGRSVGGNALSLNHVTYPHGVGTHATSVFSVKLHGAATRFSAVVGMDDETLGNVNSATFEVIVDGKVAAQTPIMHGGDPARLISVDLNGARSMLLVVGDGGDGITWDHADWAGAEISLASDSSPKPESVPLPETPARLTIPAPDPHPAIHGPRIVGTTPGKPFIFRIPATGDGPLTFSAAHLPRGLTLDPSNGVISGSVAQEGSTVAVITVHGSKGTERRHLQIVAGDHMLARTPPMGWNSWNVWGTSVNEDRVKAAANELIQTGLASHGFEYVNIDDAWEGGRDPQGNIQTNEKFADMKALGDYLHRRGLRFGIYSSPGPRTCGGYTASYQHEQQDANSYASWGVDYLKYDWCSYGEIAAGDSSLAALRKPYQVMAAALSNTNRDIFFSFCQYGMGDVWKWGAETGGNCWRTTGDIQDDWSSLHSIYESQAGHEVYAGPGHWNDPDMLMVGIVGFGNTHPTHLTKNEQIVHISMWCLLSAPLLIGCDLTRLDPFTLAVLSNDEALDIDQDPLGKPASRISHTQDDVDVWARPLFDGTHAVGLVNGAAVPETITVHWSDLGIHGSQPVRDLWLHKNVGKFKDQYSIEVPSHCCVLLKVGKAK